MNGSSRRVILVCEECGERTVLGEPLSVWYSESTHFGASVAGSSPSPTVSTSRG